MLRKPQEQSSLVGLALSSTATAASYVASPIAHVARTVGREAVGSIDLEAAWNAFAQQCPELAEVMRKISVGTGIVWEKLRGLFESKSMAIPRRSGSNLSMKEMIVLLLMGTGSAFVAESGKPHPHPLPRYFATSVLANDELPSPDEDLETIMWKLPTPQRYAQFVKKHAKYDANVHHILQFHISPQDFQDGGFRGVCNNLARFFCECMERHGYTGYYGNLIQQNPLDVRPSTSHQFSFIRTAEDTYWISDNLECIEWKGSIDEYIAQKYPTMKLAPWGIAQYQRPQENIISRTMVQLRAPEEIRISPLPNVSNTKTIAVASN